jgi:protein-disulfide isomerase
MHKIQSFFGKIIHRVSVKKISTPTAIILGSMIIAAGIVSYGFIVRSAGALPQERDIVQEIAKELKLKGSTWETCLASEESLRQVERELNDGVSAGVNGTPTTFILVRKNGLYETVARIEGVQDESESIVRSAVEQALSGTAKTEPFTGSQISDSEFINGTKSDVVMLEYADAECPFCVKFHPTVVRTMDTYGNRIGYVYRHFPLPARIHPNAVRYAMAIECAGNLKGKDAYFEFINRMFVKQAQN